MARQTQSRPTRGFSLVELLVVIGIIAALVGILLPALNAAREHAKRIVCMSNTHQLAIAWTMYAQANRGRLCSANPSSDTFLAGIGLQPKSFSWVGDGTDPSQGLLWPYVRDARVYFCPNLPGLGQPPLRFAQGQDLYFNYKPPKNYTSYSMNAMLAGDISSPFLGRTILSITEIKHPESTFVFIEQVLTQFCSYTPPIYRGSNSNLGMGFHTPPGCYHALGGANGCTLSFADGHAIFWQYANTTTYSINYTPVPTVCTADVYQLAAWSGGPCPPEATP